jgi:hypothetical protein
MSFAVTLSPFCDGVCCTQLLASRPLPEIDGWLHIGSMTDQEIQEFIAAWKQEFSEELTEAEATMEMDRLCRFFSLIAEADSARQSEAESRCET